MFLKSLKLAKFFAKKNMNEHQQPTSIENICEIYPYINDEENYKRFSKNRSFLSAIYGPLWTNAAKMLLCVRFCSDTWIFMSAIASLFCMWEEKWILPFLYSWFCMHHTFPFSSRFSASSQNLSNYQTPVFVIVAVIQLYFLFSCDFRFSS